MRIYIKDVKDVDNNIQVINTKTGNDVTFLPGIGEVVLEDYIVVNKEWKTIAQDNGKLIVWCRKLEKIKLTYTESISSFISNSTTVIQEQEIKEQNLPLLPNPGDNIELSNTLYLVGDIKKIWNSDNIVTEIIVKLKKI